MKCPPPSNPRVAHKQKERDDLQRDVDEFHRKGGKTYHCRPGEVGVPPPSPRRELRSKR